MSGSGPLRTLPALVAGVLATSAAQAAVDDIDATVTAEVQEFIGADLSNSDLAFDELGETVSTLPLAAEVELSRWEEEQEVAGVWANTRFEDPRLSVVPEADEFGIDVAGFSTAAGISHAARSIATETRQITFLESEIGAPNESELQARSRFFVDGVVIIWGELTSTELSGTTAQISLSVKQTRPGDESATTVLTAGLSLEGSPAEGAPVSLSTSGALDEQDVTLVNLTDLVPELGAIHVVVIPETAIGYVYPAAVGEQFTLDAEIEASIRTRPGTGAAVQLGVPLSELISLINEVGGEGVGDSLEQVLETAWSSNLLSAKPVVPSAGEPAVTVLRIADPARLFPSGLCGGLGIEFGLLPALFAVWIALSSHRKWG